MKIMPTTLHAANAFVLNHHRHNKPVRGCRFCLSAWADENMFGVVIVGRPISRILDDGLTAEVTRLCVMDDAPKNTCSFLYRAAYRGWIALGGKRW